MVLELPQPTFFFDARHLSHDGRPGGYVRVSNDIDPIDVASVWDADGTHHILFVPGPHESATVQGFSTDGRIVGSIRYRTQPFPVPVAWDADGSGFRVLPDFGNGGIAWAGNQSIICGETGDPAAGSTYMYRLTIWDADGTNPRVATGIEPTRRTRAFSVNTRGVYVGTSLAPDFTRRAFVGRDGTAQLIDYPGFTVTRAIDVNESDWVVGTWAPSPTVHDRAYVAKAFGSDIRDLGLFPGMPGAVANAINDDGVIVGAALQGGTGVRALYWPPGSVGPVDFNTMVDLPAWETLVEAIDINNAGQVLARGYGGYYVFTPVPEPGLLAVGTFVPAALPRRRTRRDR